MVNRTILLLEVVDSFYKTTHFFTQGDLTYRRGKTRRCFDLQVHNQVYQHLLVPFSYSERNGLGKWRHAIVDWQAWSRRHVPYINLGPLLARFRLLLHLCHLFSTVVWLIMLPSGTYLTLSVSLTMGSTTSLSFSVRSLWLDFVGKDETFISWFKESFFTGTIDDKFWSSGFLVLVSSATSLISAVAAVILFPLVPMGKLVLPAICDHSSPPCRMPLVIISRV